MKSDSTLEGEMRQAVLKAAFERLAPGLEHFADRHALHIERYKRGFSIWMFQFRHPKGGAASLQLGISLARETGELRATVLAHWWVELADEQRRLAAEFPVVRLAALEAAEVLETLERELCLVRAADERRLTRETCQRRRGTSPPA